MNKEQKEFDRSMCFTFFKTYHEQIMDVKEEFGLEDAFKVYEAIVNYGLYQTEITDRRLRILMGNATREQIELSQQKRSKGFSGENFEQTKLVAEYMRDHPGASQRTIADVTKVSKTKVAKVQKNIRESEFENIEDYLKNVIYPNLNNSSNGNGSDNYNNNSKTETESDQRDQSSGSSTETASPITEASPPPTPTPTELTWEEYTSVMDIWEKSTGTHKSPNDIADELNLNRGLVNEAINEYKANNYVRREAPNPEHIRIIKYDNQPTDYYTDEFDIDPDELPKYYEEFTNPFGFYKFQIKFVNEWFLEKYGYVHKNQSA